MDVIQEQHEQAVGDQFIDWFNHSNGTAYQYLGRAGEAPDLIYADNDIDLCLEITDAYYDSADVELRWKIARGVPSAPDHWSGVNFNDALVSHITSQVAKKALNSYGESCILVVNVRPAITSASDIKRRLEKMSIPPEHSF